MPLNTLPNIQGADDFYERLIALHDGLDAADSMLVNARLILLLANHIGDDEALSEALDIAKG